MTLSILLGVAWFGATASDGQIRRIFDEETSRLGSLPWGSSHKATYVAKRISPNNLRALGPASTRPTKNEDLTETAMSVTRSTDADRGGNRLEVTLIRYGSPEAARADTDTRPYPAVLPRNWPYPISNLEVHRYRNSQVTGMVVTAERYKLRVDLWGEQRRGALLEYEEFARRLIARALGAGTAPGPEIELNGHRISTRINPSHTVMAPLRGGRPRIQLANPPRRIGYLVDPPNGSKLWLELAGSRVTENGVDRNLEHPVIQVENEVYVSMELFSEAQASRKTSRTASAKIRA